VAVWSIQNSGKVYMVTRVQDSGTSTYRFWKATVTPEGILSPFTAMPEYQFTDTSFSAFDRVSVLDEDLVMVWRAQNRFTLRVDPVTDTLVRTDFAVPGSANNQVDGTADGVVEIEPYHGNSMNWAHAPRKFLYGQRGHPYPYTSSPTYIWEATFDAAGVPSFQSVEIPLGSQTESSSVMYTSDGKAVVVFHKLDGQREIHYDLFGEDQILPAPTGYTPELRLAFMPDGGFALQCLTTVNGSFTDLWFRYMLPATGIVMSLAGGPVGDRRTFWQ